MKALTLQCRCAALLTALLLSIAAAGNAAETAAAKLDPVSGEPLDQNIELFYQERFDDLCTQYASQLSDGERYCAGKVYDAIASISFRSDESLASRKRIFDISSAGGLHAILTGFFDPNDAGYASDDAAAQRLNQILSACGVRMEDYYLCVIRNVPGLPEPVAKDNWYCTLTLKEAYSPSGGDSIVIVLYGGDMKTGAFVMNPDIAGF